MTTTSALELIAAERQRQIEQEGWTPEHDDGHGEYGTLGLAAASYATPPRFRVTDSLGTPEDWPWGRQFWKPMPDDRVRELVKAGALIVAEIERLQRRGDRPDEAAHGV